MSPPTFVNLCRDIKYLDKTFTSENALTVFEVGRYVDIFLYFLSQIRHSRIVYLLYYYHI